MTMFTDNDKSSTPSSDDLQMLATATPAIDASAEAAGPNGFEAMGLLPLAPPGAS